MNFRGDLYKIQGLSFAYGEQRVLDDLSLSLPPGRLIGLLGPNGSGKTTLMDLLMGVRQPERGSIEFLGRPLAAWSRAELSRRVALAPQEFAVDFPFSVAETVLMGRHPYIPRFAGPSAKDLDQVNAALAAVAMRSMAGKEVTRLSGGEKQRVILARALAQTTQVLLLDEPTSNLDINHALSILRLCERLVRQEGKSVLAVLHDLHLAGAFCDHLVMLKEGQVFAAGPREEVLTPGNLAQVFGVAAQVGRDQYGGGLWLRFQKEAAQW